MFRWLLLPAALALKPEPVPQPAPVPQPTPDHEEDLRLSPLTDLTKPDLWYIFLQADGDENGKLSKLEFFNFCAHYREEIERSQHEKLQPDVDLDKDGALSFAELEKHLETWEIEGYPQELERVRELEKAKFKVADADNNGKLEGEELINMYGHGINEKVLEVEAKDALKSKDLDKDGKLNLKEFFYDYLRPEEDDDHDEDPRDKNVTFTNLDGNGDGLIDLQELMIWEGGFYFMEEAVDKILLLADKDGDHQATFQELADAWHDIEETGAQLPLRGIIIRALGEHEGEGRASEL
ncbi:unnamed protein product [Effrenium voratum]|uniref:EF-hand domain-containing protein n=2 Tax=Effrenium voratum TaxID=2562239 RepID=A0AA36MKD0_9DINO|nr:unnamed protein product [Effrenium voratum]